MPFAVSTHQMSTTPNMWTPNPIFCVPEIHLIYPVGSREIDTFSGKIYFFLNPSKNGGDIIGKFRGRPRHTKNTAPTDLCCAPRAPLSEDWGYLTTPAPWRRRPWQNSLELKSEFDFFHKICNIKAKFSQYCTKLTNIYTNVMYISYM